MARGVRIIVTGDKELTRMLAALQRNTGRKLHRTAARAAAKLILDDVKSHAPVVSGAYRRSLTVRATKRSRKGMGYRVTQKELKGETGKKQKIFYGSFLEYGYRAVGRPRGLGSKASHARALEAARKIPGQWIMKHAGDRNEARAIALYHTELRRLITEAQ